MRNEQDLTAITYHKTMLKHLEQKRDYSRPQLNIARTISGMSRESLHEEDKEMLQEYALKAGRSFDPQRIVIPFSEFRGLSKGVAGAGGYLITTNNADPVDILRPWSVTINGGITVEENLTSDITIPKTTTTSTIYWQSTETSQASTSTPVIGQVGMTPKVAIGVINCSRNFMLQADPERWLRRELIRTAAAAIDQSVLSGSGASGQPLGLVNCQGLSTQSGTSLSWSGALTMKKNAGLVNAQDGSIAFISTPTVRALLEGREKASGNGGFIWQDDKIANCPGYSTTLMSSATMLSGPMSGVTLGLWGGMEIQVNPYDPSLFKNGVIQVRVLVACDVAITVDLTSFTLATSIT